jgi:hypothetical protein
MDSLSHDIIIVLVYCIAKCCMNILMYKMLKYLINEYKIFYFLAIAPDDGLLVGRNM